jgi:hypothetical protein
MARAKGNDPPDEVRAIRAELNRIVNMADPGGRRVGDATRGVYAFYDYDGEPIYVGQTVEKLRTRIRRHLTNQRTDAVAMNVLDPFEVAEIEIWPFWDLATLTNKAVKPTLISAEYTVFQDLLSQSAFHAVLNEVPVAPAPVIALPQSVRERIVPPSVFEQRSHPDIRVARRASTIAKLAQVISERSVQAGLRQTLLTQARRLAHLAEQRLDEIGGPPLPGSRGDLKQD